MTVFVQLCWCCKKRCNPEGLQEDLLHIVRGAHLFSSGKCIVGIADQSAQPLHTLGHIACYTMDLAQNVAEDFRVSQFCKDILVPVTHPVDVVGMGRNMILILALPSTC